MDNNELTAKLLAEHYQKGREEFAKELYDSFFEMEGEVFQTEIGEYDKLISAHLIKDKMNELNKFTLSEEKPKVIILDDNELSIAKYAEEYPENFKEISDGLSEVNEGGEK